MAQSTGWLEQRLRFFLLPHNQYFRQRLNEIRSDLGISPGGFTNEDDMHKWEVNRSMADETFGQMLPATELRDLMTSFNLPELALGAMVHWLLMGDEPTTWAIQEVDVQRDEDLEAEWSLGYWLEQPNEEDFIPFSRRDVDLEDIPGTLVTIRLIVNEATTEEQFHSAWEFVKGVRSEYLAENRRGGRRKSSSEKDVERLGEYLRWYLAKRRMSWVQLADRFNRPVRTLQYGVNRIDQLMKPVSRKDSDP